MSKFQSPLRIGIFRARNARDLGEETMSVRGISPGDIAGLTAMLDAGLREGGQAKLLFENAAAGLGLTHVWFKAHYPLPRHSHNAHCLYYIISGEVRLGTEVLRAGDGFFVPAGDVYTYEAGDHGVELLEFRTATQFDIQFKMPDAMWRRLAETVVAQRAGWVNAVPPLAVRRMSGEE